MPRIPYPDAGSLSDIARQTLDAMPVSLNILRMTGYLDESCPALLQLGAKILTTQELSPMLRELAVLRIARLSSAEYEWVQHVAFAENVGVTDEQIDALDHGHRTGDCFNELETLVLEFTDEVVRSVRPSDLVLQDLRNKLSNREVLELTCTIGFYMMMARMMEVTGVEVDEPGGLQVLEALNDGA